MLTLEASLDRCSLFLDGIGELMQGFDFGGGRRAQFSGSLYVLTFWQCRAVEELIRKPGLRSAAFSLVRPCAESAAKSLYIRRCASEQQLDRLEDGSVAYPLGHFRPMVEELRDSLAADRFLEASGIRGIFHNVIEGWSLLNGFTHGGMEQISRFGDEKGWLQDVFKEEECIVAMASAAQALEQCTLTLLALDGRKVAAQKTHEAYEMAFPNAAIPK